ncbi:hypothetical protein CVD28_25325 [Bacillus sp. M6-12]|uniref:RDD family protein n=1 Tax=Bacillus sp. M6-12 TaxID=2054166 RepID=UPI000C75AB20|nr:hypothetical protein CVD28_25325 [Bacillus sp. M6-12]
MQNSAEEEERIGINESTPQEPQNSSLLFAGFWMRFWAYVLDLIIVGSIDRLIFKPLLKASGMNHFDTAIFSPVTIASAVVFYLYFVLMTKYLGQTLGKMVFGLKVVGLKGNRLSWGTVLFRELIGRFISKTTFIGYIIVGFLPKKQGLHDIFADTAVVLEKR